MIYLRQSTASQEIPLGFFLDSTDGNTEETGLTIANTDIKIWKTGATTLANKNSGGGTHIANGIYYAVLDATDTDTIGPLVIFCHVSGALAIRLECQVLDEAMYDWWFGTSAPTTGSGLDAAGVRAAIGMSSANLDTQLAAIDDAIDTEVGAIKTKTDFLPSATAGTNGGLVTCDADNAVKIQGGFKKNTALSAFPFVMVDNSGVPRTGLTSITAQRSIDGGAFASCTNSVAEVSNGDYKIDLSAGDMNGRTIILRFTATGAQDRLITIVTVD
jgi:hypothetical protein